MGNPSILYPFFFLFFFFPVCRHPIRTSAPHYIAVDDITLNCGASVVSRDGDQRVWIGDMDSESALITEPHRKSFSSMAKQSGYIDAVPYKTARISYFQFSYQFLVSPGPKFLRLYFFKASYQGFDNSTALFTVKAGSFTLLSNFSASLANSSNGGAMAKEFCVIVGEERKLSVVFIPCPSSSSKFYAFINGIQIVSMPDHLYYPEGTDLSYVGQFSRFSLDYHTALEMVVRLNVGGSDISPVDDSGMFRKWSKDDRYFLGRRVISHHPDLKPVYSKIPNYTAPDDVYRTAVTMGPNRTKILVSNLTWQLPVDPGFDYLVRLHFCEIEREITSVGERQFIIYIDNKTAEAWADVLLWSRRSETPVYKDYVVRIQDKAYLFVALQPIVRRYGITNVILNGLELFKLSDDNGNFVVQAESRRKKTIVVALGTDLGILVVLTCVVIWKPWKKLVNWAKLCLQRSMREIIGPYLKEEIFPDHFTVLREVVEDYLRERGNQRPTMNDVMEKPNFALEPQEIADAGKEKFNSGGQCIYPDALSSPVCRTNSVPRTNSDPTESVLKTAIPRGSARLTLGSCPKRDKGKSIMISSPVASTSSVPPTSSGFSENGLEASSLPGGSCLKRDKGKSIVISSPVASTSSVPPTSGGYGERGLEATKGGTRLTTSTSLLPRERCRHFTLEEMKRATQNFKEELVVGNGGFGKVYKGVISEGKVVAIKRLIKHSNPQLDQGSNEFRAEIMMLSQLWHVHVISLVGYCTDEDEMIIVYDFMGNGSLRDHLYGTQNEPLSWKQRLQICIGVASGLDYLHTGVEQPIIHRDLKTTNILLDDKWKAKVSDFGLCKQVREDSVGETKLRGTIGYWDPDYARSGQLTVKSDVYSFGVVLLEVLCARKALDDTLSGEKQNLADWAKLCLRRRTIEEIIDPYLRGKIASKCLKSFLKLVGSCLYKQSSERHPMSKLKEWLELILELQEIADAKMEKKCVSAWTTPPASGMVIRRPWKRRQESIQGRVYAPSWT